MNYSVGDVVMLDNAKIYGLYESKQHTLVKSGKFYIYNDTVKNGRIRITDAEDKIGKPCMSTGWVNINDLK